MSERKKKVLLNKLPLLNVAFFFTSINSLFHIDEKEQINNSMGKLSEGIQWAKAALLEWRQVMASGDEANKMIEKLCRVDAGRAEVGVHSVM